MTLREERRGIRFLVTWTRKRAGGEVAAARTLQYLSAKVNGCFKPHLQFALLQNIKTHITESCESYVL